MRRWTFSLAVAVMACSGTKKPGPLGQPIDLRDYLPPELKTGGVSVDTAYHQRLKVGPDSALIEVTWTPLQNGKARLLGEVKAELLEPVKYDSLRIGEIGNLINIGSKMEPVESAALKVRWFKTWFTRPRAGYTDFQFDAKGRRMITPERH
jgi:hypothetical protein